MTKKLLREGQRQDLDSLLELSAAMQAISHHTADHTATVLDADGSARHVPWARDTQIIVVLWESADGWRVAQINRSDIEIAKAVNLAGEPRDHIRVDLTALSGAVVPADTPARLLRRGALARTLAMAMAMAGAGAGAMERVLHLVVERTAARVQFGRALGKVQAVQHMVANIASVAALARAAAEAAAAIAEDHGFDCTETEFAVAKTCAGHAADVDVSNAYQSLDAIGFTTEHEQHRHTNRLLAWRAEYGATRHWDEVLLATAVDAGARGLWPLLTGSSGTGEHQIDSPVIM